MKTKTVQQDNHLTANAPQSVVIAIMIHAHNTNTTTCLCYSCLTYYMQLGVVLYFFRGGGPLLLSRRRSSFVSSCSLSRYEFFSRKPVRPVFPLILCTLLAMVRLADLPGFMIA